MKKIIITIIMSITVLLGNQRLCDLSIDTAVAYMIEVENSTDPVRTKEVKKDLKVSIFSVYRDCEGHLTKEEITKALLDGEASK